MARARPRNLLGCGLLLFLPGLASAQQPGGASPHGSLAIPCITCHSADAWRPARIDRSFNHARFGFPLQEAHAPVACTACHSSLEFSRVEKTCAGCHKDVHSGELGLDCAQCHNTRAFNDRAPLVRAHALSRFPLEGAHRAVDCSACHISRAGQSMAFRGAPTECIGCHRPDFEKTTSPNHPAAHFSTDCVQCHSNLTWSRAGFDHNATRFPLTGAHLAAGCQACHRDGVYKGKVTTCIGCHQAVFNSTTNPPHQSAGFPADCTVCHSTVTWTGAVFDHNATQFPLTGEHREVKCAHCHGDGVYRGKSTACVSCHRSNFETTQSPPHLAAGFATDCTACHTTATWMGAAFDHNTTRFPLTGAHLAANCVACHSDGVYHGKPTACLACHQNNYNATTNPPHQAAGFATDCTGCHTTAVWTGAVFNHNTTSFPLTGAHQAATCQACHGDGVYRGKLTTCVSCHQNSYNSTANPPHQAAGFPTDCTSCHNTVSWAGAPFNHSATRFPLTGAHLTAACTACHGDGVYHGKPTTCVACHVNNYNATSNPPHQAAGFPTDCTSCHSTVSWAGAPFNHSATRFPLTGAHLAIACTACHGDGVYHGKPTSCLACHQTTYNSTASPPHQAAGFATDCTSCHTTATWAGAVFNHSTTQFPLTGAHTSVTCQQCHGDGVYRGKPTTCVSCHLTTYNATSNPAHQAAGFPTDCLSCHTTATWLGATFNHDGQYFPIYSGKHRNRWATCDQCHANLASYAQFTCLTCHEHSQTQMDGTHRGRAGYSYQSSACYSCHPRP